MSGFCGINCFCRELTEELTQTGGLSADLQLALAANLPIDKYTRLTLCGPFGCEIIKVVNKAGTICIEARGEENTDIQSWPKGSKIKFEFTNQNMRDFIDCKNAEDAAQEEGLPIKSDYFDITFDEESGKWCVEPPEQEAEGDEYGKFEFKSCGFRYFLKNGQWCRTPCAPGEVPPDGVYSNPDIIVENGCLMIKPTSGSGLQSKCGCCGKCGTDKKPVAITEAEPAIDGSEGCFWYKKSTGCLSVLCDGDWLGL